MSFTSKLYSLISKNRLKSIDLSRKNPELFQRKLFNELIKRGAKTEFGKEHNFEAINSIDKYGQNVPLRDYNMFEPYIERVRKQEKNVLWDTPVKWFAKSSGTSSSKSKFIPITKDSLQNCHYSGMKKMIATYIDNNPMSQLFDGDALTLGGSVTVDELGFGKSSYGDLSAVLLKNSPLFVEMRRVPKRKIALLPDFEQKVDIICKNALKYNVTNFSGVPSWNMVLFRKILDYTGKTNLKELWPNLELFMHGGINFEPYRNEYKKIISGEMNYMENYNASEGYFAFQDDPLDKSMLLLTDNGIFYEFIPMEKLEAALAGSFNSFNTVEDVKTGINYAIVITTNGGLWRYLIGDSIKFTSLKPHKFIITGRTQLFINTFGEELMIHNAEHALTKACQEHNITIENYTVAPVFMSDKTKGYHQWLIEFKTEPTNKKEFADSLDRALCSNNSDYEAKRKNNITMEPPQIVSLKKGAFYSWLESKGKLGGQNKVPRLSNNRTYAQELLNINEGLNL